MRKLYMFCWLFISCLAFAQVTFRAVTGKEKVAVGESFELNFVLTLENDANIGVINYPSFKGLKMIGRKRGRQLSIINGEKTIQNVETIILRPEKKGKIRIGKASIIVDDKEYETNDVVIHVTDAPKISSRNKANQVVFLDVELSQDTAYLNEPIYATVKLYSKSYDVLRRRSDLDIPSLNKIQIKQLPSPNDEYRDITQEELNNQLYISEVLGKYTLTPQRTGELTVPPFSVRVVIPIDFFDEKIVELYSPQREIKVKRLPSHAPKSFKGAVGEFTFRTYVNNKNNLEQNKAFEVVMELTGTGNLSGIDLPKLSLNDDLETYTPKRKKAYKEEDNMQSGKIVDTYIVVPQYGGTYEIPQAEFSYFNPNTAKYVTLQSNKIELNVSGDEKELNNEDSPLANEENIAPSDSVVYDLHDEGGFSKDTPDSKEVEITQKTKDTKDKKYNSLIYISLVALAGLIFIFYLSKKRKKERKARLAKGLLSKAVLKKNLAELKAFYKQKQTSEFCGKAQELLKNIVAFYTKDSKLKTEEESYTLLKEHKTESYAETWKETHQNLQMIQYAGVNKENLNRILINCEDLVKQTK